MQVDESTVVKAILGGVTAFVLWLIKLVWGDHRKAITDIAKDLKEIKDKLDAEINNLEERVVDLEKTDVGVQIHLDSLKELKSQVDGIAGSLMSLTSLAVKRDD